MQLHVLFEDQARRRPGVVAVTGGPAGLTYAELNATANRVARHLQVRGVTPGSVVAVHAERGVELVAGLLGALKAGAGYTLVDPDLPAARRDRVLADSGAGVVLTGAEIAAVDLALDDTDLGITVPADAVACVMFTSGSTGRPKGAVASHRALAGTYLGQDYAAFGPGEVWLQCSPVSWDAFGLELFGALLFGGTCVLQPGQRPDPATMVELVTRHGVTQLQLSASLFNFLVDDFPQVFARLRTVFTGGERASVVHVGRIMRRFPALRVVNGYGPVESFGFTTTHLVSGTDLDRPAIPIGAPVAGKGVRVLDDKLGQSAPGVVGEVYATGVGLAHGYARQPGATARSFLPDPYGPPGSRMYRTGDLGQWNTDGTLHVVGRADDQVKVRGFRVEPGEVAAALRRHPAVADCAVVADQGPDVQDVQLAAYLVGSGAPGYQQVRRYLADRLPDYMIPASVTVLDALPLTANGKLDRAALPAPNTAAVGPAGSVVAEGGLLGDIARVWCDVLGVDAVGPDDDFFQLGGHSLTALRALYALRTQLGVEIALRDLLDATDLATFTTTVRRLVEHGAPAARPVPLLTGRRGTR